jgi:lysophospholipase L1-like esterase
MMERPEDMRREPVNRIVALGESTTWGYSVSNKEKCWVNCVARMIEQWQGSPVELINQGIGSNVITTECPAYPHSVGPAALERVDEDVNDLSPDLVLVSYGLNDSRGGTTPEIFRRALTELISRLRTKKPPLIVLLNTYYMHEVCYSYPNWNKSNYEVTEVFNLVTQQVADATDCICADIYAAEVGVDRIIDEDHCHPNDLGHFLVANRVFEAIVRNCSFVARNMPKETLIKEFSGKYGNGPDRPSGVRRCDDTSTDQDVMVPQDD